jgi:hypothetical protein
MGWIRKQNNGTKKRVARGGWTSVCGAARSCVHTERACFLNFFHIFSEGVRSLRCDYLMTVRKFKKNWTADGLQLGFCLILTRFLVDLNFTKKKFGVRTSNFELRIRKFFRHRTMARQAIAALLLLLLRHPPPPPTICVCTTSSSP